MTERPVDPSAIVDDETPDDFDPEAVIERWNEIKKRGYAIPEGESDAEEK